MFAAIEAFDEKVSLYVMQHRMPPRLHKIAQWYTRLGDGYVWALVVVALFVRFPQAEVWYIVKRSFLAGGLSLFVYLVMKNIVQRPRPYQKLKSIVAEVPPLDEFSFPSGHTMNNLAAGFTLLSLVGDLGLVVVVMPITWGLLRIYFGVHWLSDVLCGIALGAISSGLAALIWFQVLNRG